MGYLLALFTALLAVLSGFLWMVIGRLGTKLDMLDTKVETKFDGMDDRLRHVEQAMAAWDPRFTHVEEQLSRVLVHVGLLTSGPSNGLGSGAHPEPGLSSHTSPETALRPRERGPYRGGRPVVVDRSETLLG